VTNHECITMLLAHPLPPLPATTTIMDSTQCMLQELFVSIGYADFDSARLFGRCPLLSTISLDCNAPHLLRCAMEDGRCVRKLAITDIRYDIPDEVACGVLFQFLESCLSLRFAEVYVHNATSLVSSAQVERAVRKNYLHLRHFKTNIQLLMTDGLLDFDALCCI